MVKDSKNKTIWGTCDVLSPFLYLDGPGNFTARAARLRQGDRDFDRLTFLRHTPGF
jgi:hypothetical protein